MKRNRPELPFADKAVAHGPGSDLGFGYDLELSGHKSDCHFKLWN